MTNNHGQRNQNVKGIKTMSNLLFSGDIEKQLEENRQRICKLK